MARALHIGLLLMALLGLTGQSGAIAMVPTPIDSSSIQASMTGTDCMDTANVPVPGKSPCEKMTMQCMVAMGCAPLVLVEPVEVNDFLVAIGPIKFVLPLATRLWGRSFGPEPDPPSFLI